MPRARRSTRIGDVELYRPPKGGDFILRATGREWREMASSNLKDHSGCHIKRRLWGPEGRRGIG